MLWTVIVFYSDSQATPKNPSKPGLTAAEALLLSRKKPHKLKTECCEKYKKKKRCKRCPCYDLADPNAGINPLPER